MSVEGTTLGDMTQAENVKDCRRELDRVTDDAGYAAWARKWGAALVSRCEAGGVSHRSFVGRGEATVVHRR